MESIKVNLGNSGYLIQIGTGLLETADLDKFKASIYIIITDSNINKLYGQKLKRRLEKYNPVVLIEVPPGELSKTWEMSVKIGRELARKKLDRDALIISLGGGVVGDLAGFVASIYKRGIQYINIPTTLLAQVDSSIGGKTGVNIPEGKNLLGSFYQPQEVIMDIKLLKQLPDREIKSGLAEVIKYSVIYDENLFQYLEEHINSREEEFYLEIVKKSVLIKSKIVEHDEKEKELRKILNYGHTIGHAIEILSDYQLTHGEAIAIGMVYEGKIAVSLGVWNEDELKRQNKLINNIGLPVSYKIEIDKIIEVMKLDKKSKGSSIYLILPEKIGKVKVDNEQVAFPVKDKFIKEYLIN